MNPKFSLLVALVAGLLPVAVVAQSLPAAPGQAAAAASSASAPQAPVMVTPSAFPARIALIMFEQAVYATNEGQHAVEQVREKYQPQKDKIDALSAEIDTLKKQLQAAPSTMTDTERAARMKIIDTKNTEYQTEAEDAQNAFNADMQDALAKVAQKVDVVMKKYVSDNGYTILLNAGDQQSPVMWAAAEPNADITAAVVEAYNATTPNIKPPAPEAPTPTATRARPSTTRPRTTGTK